MRLAGVLGAFGAFSRRQDALGVDLALELVERRLAGLRGSGRSVFGARPRFMGGDLRSE